MSQNDGAPFWGSLFVATVASSGHLGTLFESHTQIIPADRVLPLSRVVTPFATSAFKKVFFSKFSGELEIWSLGALLIVR